MGAKEELIHRACRAQDLELVKKYSRQYWMPAQNGVLPLHICAYNNFSEGMEVLLRAGAEPDPRLSSDGVDDTPLLICAKFGNNKSMEILLKNGANPNLEFESRTSPLEETAKDNNIEGARILLRAGASANYATLMAATGCAVILSMVWVGASIEVEVREEFLYDVMMSDDPDVLNDLIGRGSAVRITDLKLPYGLDVLSLASERCAPEVVRVLLEEGANVMKYYAKAIDTPLIKAALAGRSENVQLLVKAGASLTRVPAEDYSGPPLNFVVRERSLRGVRCLVDVGCCIHQPGGEGYSPIHVATLTYDRNIIRQVVALGGDPNQNDGTKDGHTPILLAVLKSEVKDTDQKNPKHLDEVARIAQVVKGLVELGARLDHSNMRNQTPSTLDDKTMILVRSALKAASVKEKMQQKQHDSPEERVFKLRNSCSEARLALCILIIRRRKAGGEDTPAVSKNSLGPWFAMIPSTALARICSFVEAGPPSQHQLYLQSDAHIANLKSELEATNAKNEILCKQVDEYKAEIEATNAKNEILCKQVEEYKTKRDSARKGENDALRAARKLKEKWELAMSELARAQEDITKLKAEAKRLKQKSPASPDPQTPKSSSSKQWWAELRDAPEPEGVRKSERSHKKSGESHHKSDCRVSTGEASSSSRSEKQNTHLRVKGSETSSDESSLKASTSRTAGVTPRGAGKGDVSGATSSPTAHNDGSLSARGSSSRDKMRRGTALGGGGTLSKDKQVNLGDSASSSLKPRASSFAIKRSKDV